MAWWRKKALETHTDILLGWAATAVVGTFVFAQVVAKIDDRRRDHLGPTSEEKIALARRRLFEENILAEKVLSARKSTASA